MQTFSYRHLLTGATISTPMVVLLLSFSLAMNNGEFDNGGGSGGGGGPVAAAAAVVVAVELRDGVLSTRQN